MNKIDIQFTKDWWLKCLKDPAKLTAWFQKLQLTEIGGYDDYVVFLKRWPDMDAKTRKIFVNIGADEQKHSDILLRLFDDRKIEAVKPSESTRSSYWSTLNEHIVDLPTCCAVNFYGESLAAYRFEIIQSMPETPSDIKSAFDIILPDEQFHRETLKRLSGEEALEAILPIHEAALAVLKRS